MRIEDGLKLDFCDVLLKPNRSSVTSRKEINLERTFKFKYSNYKWTGIPLISSNMFSVTTELVADAMASHHMLACVPKNSVGDWYEDYTYEIPSIGLQDKAEPIGIFNWLCLDVPNGYIEAVIEKTKQLREDYPWAVIIVGNIVTGEATEDLIRAGADIVKVGIGNGSCCSTRIKTGVGMPQLSAIIECADAAHGIGGHIISDGGCIVSGDIVKALAAGADFVMLGGMLSGVDENGVDFYGSSSERGNNETAGGLKDYRTSEGWEMKLKPKGPIDKTLQDIMGGLRSACSYVGARSIEDLPKHANFIRVNRQANTSLWENRI